MLSIRFLTRGSLPQYAAPRLHTSSFLHDSSDSSSSDSDKASKKKKLTSKPVQSEEQKLQAQQETTNRLNSLLDQMIKREPKIAKTLDLSVPSKKPKTPEPPKKTYEESLLGAAKQVATSLGGDVQKTESDLLNKLLSSDTKKTEASLDDPKTPLSLSELVAGMKIDRTPSKPSAQPTNPRMARAQAVGKEFESMRSSKYEKRPPFARMRDPRTAESAHLYEGKPFLIFEKAESPADTSEIPKLTTWETLQKREFKLTLSHPPENIFQEMILWTEQGKLWKFPIDNEQGMEEEHSVHFSEHVFMERHLQDWCPRKGPIRHFMELVCVGLSKNPYMTVSEKKEHIAWFREYFASKQDLLKELNAIETDIPLPSKQIEA